MDLKSVIRNTPQKTKPEELVDDDADVKADIIYDVKKMDLPAFFGRLDSLKIEKNRMLAIRGMAKRVSRLVTIRNEFAKLLCSRIAKKTLNKEIPERELQSYINVLVKSKFLANANKNLQGAFLNKISFYKAHLYYSWLTRASFSGANFTKAFMDRSNLSKSEFVGAIFRDAALRSSTVDEAIFERSDMKHVSFLNAKITNTYMNRCNIPDADFRGTRLVNVKFEDTVLDGTQFQNATLKGVKFTSAKLIGCDFEFATFEGGGTDFTNADMRHVKNLHYTVVDEDGNFADAEYFIKRGARIQASVRQMFEMRPEDNIKDIKASKKKAPRI